VRRILRPLAVLGPFAIVAVLSELHGDRIADNPYEFTSSSRLAWAVVYASALGVAAYGFGLPDQVRGRRGALAGALGAAAAAALVVSIVQLASGDALLPRFVVFGAALLSVPWWVLCAALAGSDRARAGERDRVLVVADAAEGAAVGRELAGHPERPATLVGVIEPAAAAARDGERPLEARALAERATVIVLDRTAADDHSVVVQAAHLHERGIRVRTLSLFYEQWFAKLPIWELERVSLMFDIGEVHRAAYVRVKRLVDLTLAVLGLVPLALLVPVVLVGDLVANRGPLFYRQARVGKGGEPFEILKFRTMAPHDGPTSWTGADDDRITPFGRLLRASHLDEAPQVLNILRGDLSVVGPRPEQPHYVAELTEKLPFYELRHLVRPGLTGWAQVKYHYGSDVHDATQKLQYEFWYLRHQSLRVDLRIMGRTLRSVLGREGR
jgi:lipopolysaccharide/colanic/teichoic acid biosynthesis glycosyltransferase